MNEEQAKEKICPIFSIVRAIASSDRFCMGSDCMMWIAEETKLAQNDDGRNAYDTVGGHCGLTRQS